MIWGLALAIVAVGEVVLVTMRFSENWWADGLVGVHNVTGMGSVQCVERACAYRWLCWTGEDDWTMVYNRERSRPPHFLRDPNRRAGNDIPNTNLKVTAVPGHLPHVFPDAEYFRGTFAVMSRYANYNPAHILGDEVFPIFASAEEFGVQGHVDVLYYGNGRVHGKRNTLLEKIFGFINATLWLNWPPSFSHPVCFERVLVGWERRGFAASRYHWEHHFLMREFRNHIWRRFGMPPSLAARRLEAGRRLRVLFVVKDVTKAEHPHFVANLAGLMNRTRARLPASTVTRAMWSTSTVQEQVQYMYNSDIVIAQPGADILITFLLAPWAQLIIIPRLMLGRWESGSNEGALWLGKSADWHATTVPEEDVVADGDWGTFVPPSVYDRILRDVVIDLNVLLEANTA